MLIRKPLSVDFKDPPQYAISLTTSYQLHLYIRGPLPTKFPAFKMSVNELQRLGRFTILESRCNLMKKLATSFKLPLCFFAGYYFSTPFIKGYFVIRDTLFHLKPPTLGVARDETIRK